MPGPVLDASTPAVATAGTGATQVQSPAFSPPANAVIFAEFGTNSGTSAAQGIASVSGGGLTWHKLGGTSQFNSGALTGCAEVWWAANPNAQTGIVVTATLVQPIADPSPGCLFQVRVYTSAASDQSTAAFNATASATGATPSIAVVTSGPNSQVNLVLANWSSATVGTPGAGQTLRSSQANAPAASSYWSQHQNAVTVAGGTTVTMSDSAPTGIHFHAVAYEVLAAAGATNDFSMAFSQPSVTLTPGTSGAVTLTTAVTAGAAQSATLTAPAAPAGITVTFTPGSITTGNAAMVGLAVAAAVAPGTYSVDVIATGSSVTHTLTLTVVVAVASAGGSGLGMPFAFPHGFGTSVPSENDAVNDGNVATPPVITLQNPGTIANPYVRNKQTGETFRLALTRNGPPSVIVIDMDAGTVTEDGQDITDDVDWTVSSFWWLLPGVTTVQLAGDVIVGVVASVAWNDAYIF
jgi:hypothetical protein